MYTEKCTGFSTGFGTGFGTGSDPETGTIFFFFQKQKDSLDNI